MAAKKERPVIFNEQLVYMTMSDKHYMNWKSNEIIGASFWEKIEIQFFGRKFRLNFRNVI